MNNLLFTQQRVALRCHHALLYSQYFETRDNTQPPCLPCELPPKAPAPSDPSYLFKGLVGNPNRVEPVMSAVHRRLRRPHFLGPVEGLPSRDGIPAASPKRGWFLARHLATCSIASAVSPRIPVSPITSVIGIVSNETGFLRSADRLSNVTTVLSTPDGFPCATFSSSNARSLISVRAQGCTVHLIQPTYQCHTHAAEYKTTTKRNCGFNVDGPPGEGNSGCKGLSQHLIRLRVLESLPWNRASEAFPTSDQQGLCAHLWSGAAGPPNKTKCSREWPCHMPALRLIYSSNSWNH